MSGYIRYTAAYKQNPWDKQWYAWGGYNISGLNEDRFNNLTLSFLKYPEKAGMRIHCHLSLRKPMGRQ